MDNTGSPIPVESEKDTTAADPVELFRVGDEVYTLYFDYDSAMAMCRILGINPLARGIVPILDHQDGLEVALWAMIAKPGPKADVPTDHRKLKRQEVRDWFSADLDKAYEAVIKIIGVVNSSVKRTDKQDGDSAEGENSNPPAEE